MSDILTPAHQEARDLAYAMISANGAPPELGHLDVPTAEACLRAVADLGREAVAKEYSLTAETYRSLYRSLRAYSRALAQAETPKGPETCWRCQRGTYVWGGSVNGVPQFSGECFRCLGTGVKPAAGWWGRPNGG